MPMDGFDALQCQAFSGRSPETSQRFYARVDELARRWHVHIAGLEHLPKGRALLVANHAFGFDVVFPVAAIAQRLGRRVWVLGEHLWWKVPFVRRFAAAVGVVDGTSENIDKLLSADELVLVLPGGMREAVKPHQLRYQLLWGQRYGFVRAAVRNRAPLVPLACVGADELLDLVGNPFRRGARWLGLHGLPLPRPSYGLPIPHPKALHYMFGEPILPFVPAEQAGDPAVLRQLRREVEGSLHELIESELARRYGLDCS
jgi:1-acyl-sn-glycerol-3-phosphate acyltransferase